MFPHEWTPKKLISEREFAWAVPKLQFFLVDRHELGWNVVVKKSRVLLLLLAPFTTTLSVGGVPLTAALRGPPKATSTLTQLSPPKDNIVAVFRKPTCPGIGDKSAADEPLD